MIKHIVLWNFKDALSEEQKEEKLQLIRGVLEAQVGRIPGLVSMTAALNRVDSPHTMDLVLDSVFEDLDSLLAYHKNPVHHEVREVVDPLVTDTRGADYEVV